MCYADLVDLQTIERYHKHERHFKVKKQKSIISWWKDWKNKRTIVWAYKNGVKTGYYIEFSTECVWDCYDKHDRKLNRWKFFATLQEAKDFLRRKLI